MKYSRTKRTIIEQMKKQLNLEEYLASAQKRIVNAKQNSNLPRKMIFHIPCIERVNLIFACEKQHTIMCKL